MEKVITGALLIVLCSGTTALKAQQKDFVRAGLIRDQLTFAPSYMFAEEQGYFYLHGSLEGYLSKWLSVAGEGYMSLGSFGDDEAELKHNHSLFFGTNMHYVHGGNDLYFGIQPGVSFTKLNTVTIDEGSLSDKTSVAPVLSAVAGYNYYVHKFFHFFLQTRIMTGQHLQGESVDLTEFRLSAGLGYNFNLKK